MQGFGLEFSELREYTHGFFSNVAEILDDGFIKVEVLCSCIELSPACYLDFMLILEFMF